MGGLFDFPRQATIIAKEVKLMIMPELKEAKALADGCTYIPIAMELFADLRTPVEALRIVTAHAQSSPGKYGHEAYILESAASGESWGRYTFLGYKPVMEVTGKDGRVSIREGGTVKVREGSPHAILKKLISAYKSPAVGYLPPFTGGFVGYFAFEYFRLAEPSLRLTDQDGVGFDDFRLLLFDKVVAFDHLRQKIFLIVNIGTDDIDANYVKGVMTLKDMESLIRSQPVAEAELGRLMANMSAGSGESVPGDDDSDSGESAGGANGGIAGAGGESAEYAAWAPTGRAPTENAARSSSGAAPRGAHESAQGAARGGADSVAYEGAYESAYESAYGAADGGDGLGARLIDGDGLGLRLGVRRDMGGGPAAGRNGAPATAARAADGGGAPKGAALANGFAASFSKSAFCAAVRKTKHYIREGDIFQCVPSIRFSAPYQGGLLPAYRTLRTTNPSAYMFYIKFSDIEFAGASPETLVTVRNGAVSTCPIAGTCGRAGDDAETARRIDALLCDEKELAEHDMLVDLGRNDIGKVSKFGTVRVDEYRSVKKLSHVCHIASKVSGEVRDGYDALDVMAALLPAGTLSGAPKKRACEIINELEC
jgi:anthranilate/para-aminobenzoate synthase component I